MDSSEPLSFKTLRQQWREREHLPLLLAAIIPALWWYGGRRIAFCQVFSDVCANHPHGDALSVLYEYIAAFVLMGVIPALLVRRRWRQPLREYGVQPGDHRTGLRWLYIGIPVMVLFALSGYLDPSMRMEYPLARSIAGDWRWFMLVEAGYLLYYTGWEFFFRGFLLFSTEQTYDALIAILIQTIPSVILHIGKPLGETAASVVAGIFFGWLALRTRSIAYPLVLHAVIGIATDVVMILLVITI